MTSRRHSANGDGGQVRPPAVADRFYPADPVELGGLVDRLLDLAPPVPPEAPLGLLVPHAALAYSGAVAASAWRLLAGRAAPTVLLAGTNHFDPLAAGVGIWPSGDWHTPLGDQHLDHELAAALLDLGPPFTTERRAHLGEHSIEVQLPLLQRVNPEARFVPFLVSLSDPTACAAAGMRLGRLLGELLAAGRDIVLVASSDLVHYPPADVAERLDRALLQPILALDGPELARLEAALMLLREPGLACGLCGLQPVLLTLAAVHAMGATHGELLAAATSADVPGGDRRRTVGYAAVAFRA
ncbi:MAG: AmmeMemoRadiSam system protein B [Candidatus Limnocylindrales bacterium]